MNPVVVEATTNIGRKVNVLELAKQLGNVSKACKMAGYSRDSFYRFRKRFEAGGEAALADISRRKPLLKNRVAPEVESAILDVSLQYPRYGQVRVAAELRKRELVVSAAGVRCVWLRHGLQTTELRLHAIAARTGSPVAAE